MKDRFFEILKKEDPDTDRMYPERDKTAWYEELKEYGENILICFLEGQGFEISLKEVIVDGTYTSVWADEGEITSKAKINLHTHEVEILESFDPAECFTEDGEPFECNILEREYVTIDGKNYPCAELNSDFWEDYEEQMEEAFWYNGY